MIAFKIAHISKKSSTKKKINNSPQIRISSDEILRLANKHNVHTVIHGHAHAFSDRTIHQNVRIICLDKFQTPESFIAISL